MPSNCEVDVRRLPGTVVLVIRGEIDSSASQPLQSAYAGTLGPDMATRVVLDFTAVDYMNSTGIALIVAGSVGSALLRRKAKSKT